MAINGAGLSMGFFGFDPVTVSIRLFFPSRQHLGLKFRRVGEL